MMMLVRVAALFLACSTAPLMAQGGGCYTDGWPYSVEATSLSDGGVRLILGPAISGGLLNQQVTVMDSVVRLQADVFFACNIPPPPPPVLQPVDVGPLAPGTYELRTELRSPPLAPVIYTRPFVVLGQPAERAIPTFSTASFVGLILGVLAIGGIAAGAVNAGYRSTG